VLPLLKRSGYGRIVNMTSGNGSFTFNTNPRVPLPDRATLLAYASSKAALNMMTLRLANDLTRAGIKVNAGLALLLDDGPTGGVFGNDGPEPW
jgi:NAD(P)-dependent dehydrogenase (short-subunit alcohol dehydrogenase family)